ncbi:MAG: aspartate kinase [Capsulimonadaceae bacterium]|nr:aspartate kinase [Capsulimonadaceae bacterium]
MQPSAAPAASPAPGERWQEVLDNIPALEVLIETMSITAKFGGTSLADANQIRKVADIIKSDPRRRHIVLSAPGKRTSSDKKITDLLYLCHSLANQGLDIQTAFGPIKQRFLGIAEELGVDEMAGWLAEVELRIADGADVDWIASRGEYLNSRMVARFLGATFIDAASAIRMAADGRLRAAETYQLLAEALTGDGLFVVPGFYGADPSGHIRCFSRGGSDITGAIVARAAGDQVYENWTDVPGLLMADPRIVDNPRPIAEVTYREQRELSYMGATVLHDEAVFPVREAGIPINIRNTNDPSAPGTRIVTTRDSSRHAVAGIAGRVGFSNVYTDKALMNAELGYGRRMLEILEKRGITFEHAPTSIDTMSVIVRDEEIAGKEDLVLGDIENQLKPDRVEIDSDIALIATVGEGMSKKVGIAARLFGALGKSGVNILMINQGASEINIIVGVAASDYEKAVRAIYGEFVKPA